MCASNSATGSAGSSGTLTGAGCTPPADAGPATGFCSNGRPQLCAVSAAVRTPDPSSGRTRRPWTLPQPSGRPHRGQAGHRRQAADAAAVRAPAAVVPTARPKQGGPLTCAAQPGQVGAGGVDTSVRPERTPDAPSRQPQSRNTWRSGGPWTAAGCRGQCGSRPGRTANSRQCPPRSLPNGSVRPWAVLSGRQRSHLRLRAPVPQPWLSGDHATDAAGNIIAGAWDGKAAPQAHRRLRACLLPLLGIRNQHALSNPSCGSLSQLGQFRLAHGTMSTLLIAAKLVP